MRRLLTLPLAALALAGAPVARADEPAPVPSLTPEATQQLWQQLVDRPRTRASALAAAADCAPLHAVFYAATDWLRLTTRLAANPSSCAQYYVSVPPLAADKSQPRADQAWRIRALGPAFHALAEINVTGWTAWVSANGGDWYAAGVEARRRMAAAGYDVAAGDTWVVNEFSSAVRQGVGAARANMRAFVHGLYDGDGTAPGVKGAVFVPGIGQSTADLSTYQARLQDWYEDAAFWADMSAYVSDWSQEVYGDVRDYAVAGAPPEARRDALAQYLQHELALARAAPPEAAGAAAFIAAAYDPLANAAWQYDSAFGWTNVPVELMEDYVSAQVYAARAAGDGRFGFAWSPRNLAGMPAADFAAQTDALLARLAAAIADSGAAPEAACGTQWCTGALDGAAFTAAWQSFETWRPSQLAFTSPAQTLPSGAASAPLTIVLRTATGVPYSAGLPVEVDVSSSSPGGELAAAPGGPWAPTLAVPIASGATTASFYYRDARPGTPTLTAAAAGKTAASQTVTVLAPPADTTPPETTITAGPSGTVTTADASFAFGASEPGSSFHCALDGAVFAACTSPKSYAGLASGSHVFAVRATDPAGNTDLTPATGTWTIQPVPPADTTPPETTLDAAPAGTVASPSATTAFSSSEPGSRFECALDAAAFAACTPPLALSGLADGAHTFAVRAIDAAGNVDPTPAVATWTVATAAPPAAPPAGGGAPAPSPQPQPQPAPQPQPSPQPQPVPVAEPPLAPATPIAFTPPPPARAPALGTVPTALLVGTPRATMTGKTTRTVTLSARLSRRATLSLTLLDGKARVLARWHRAAKAGPLKLALRVPAQARHPRRALLRITAGTTRKVVPVGVRG